MLAQGATLNSRPTRGRKGEEMAIGSARTYVSQRRVVEAAIAREHLERRHTTGPQTTSK